MQELTKDQIHELIEFQKSIRELVTQIPNDMQLGEAIRNFTTKTEKK